MLFISKPEERHVINQGKFLIESIIPGLKLQDPQDHGLGPLGRVDHTTLKPGVFIGMHPHANDEILSYIRKGTMIHEDSQRNRVKLGGTRMMVMNAGSGVMHQESVAAEDDEIVEMLQIFIRPKGANLEPIIQIHDFDALNSENQWRLIGAPETDSAPLTVRSQVWLYDVHLKSSSIETPILNELSGLLYVFDGEVTFVRDNELVVLKKGSSVVIRDERINVSSKESADLVFFILDENSSYSRAGAYSG
jgi:redox-sensitive bicupin YhaK (pirin superfamily)